MLGEPGATDQIRDQINRRGGLQGVLNSEEGRQLLQSAGGKKAQEFLNSPKGQQLQQRVLHEGGK